MAKEQDRGPGARKVELERRLDANTGTAQQGLDTDSGDEQAMQTGSGRGHKAQQAERHRSGRPSGGNVSGGGSKPDDFER